VFDEHGCDIGLRRLGAYKEYFVDGNDEFSKKPKHDMASHCADAFRYAMYNFYFEPKERLTWQKDPNAIYGSDLMNKSTKRKLESFSLLFDKSSCFSFMFDVWTK
jgi:hypothetical protein